MTVSTKDPKEKFSLDLYTFIRGFPRLRADVEEIEKRYGAKLVSDLEIGLIRRLDTALFNAKRKLDKWPEMLQMPEDSLNYYIPMPYPLKIWGLTLDVYNKPAWFRMPKTFEVAKIGDK